MKEYWCLALTLLGLVLSLQSVDTTAINEKLRKRSLYNTEGFVEDYSFSEMDAVENEDFFIRLDRELHSSMSMPAKSKSKGKGGKGKGGKGKGGKSKADEPTEAPVTPPTSKGGKGSGRSLYNTEGFVQDYSFSEMDAVENEDFFIHLDRELHSSMSMPAKSKGKGKEGKGKGGKGKGGKGKADAPTEVPVTPPASKGGKGSGRSLYNTEGFVQDYSFSEMDAVENEDFFIHLDRELHSSMSMPAKSKGKGKGGKGKGGKGKGGKSKADAPTEAPVTPPTSKGGKGSGRSLYNTEVIVEDYSFLEKDVVENGDVFIHFDRELHSSMSMPAKSKGEGKGGKGKGGKGGAAVPTK